MTRINFRLCVIFLQTNHCFNPSSSKRRWIPTVLLRLRFLRLKNAIVVGSFHHVYFKLGCYLPLQYVQDEQQTASLSRQQILDAAMPPLGLPLWPKRMQWRAEQYSSRDTSSALIRTSSSLTWKYRNQAILKHASMIILKQQISLLNNSRITHQ